LLLGVRLLGWLCSILKGEEMKEQLRAHAMVDQMKPRKGDEMILNDREITAFAKNGMITPFAEGIARPGVISYGVTSFGYDMRVADEWAMYISAFDNMDQYVDPKNVLDIYEWRRDDIYIEPGDFVLCRSVETFDIPEDVFGIVVGKWTYARCGLIVNCTPMEPGWTGQLTIELHNASQHAIKVYANEGIAQVMFFRGERPAVTYADKRGKYQGQSGVTLPRVTE
jgi:dCTP deaminase